MTLTAEGQGLVLGGAETDVTFGEQPSSSQMDVLCSSLMSSPRFAEYAAKRKVDSAADVPGTTTAVDASTLPGELAECDGNECAKGNPGTWIFHATTGVGRQPNGAVYDLTITRFDGDTIEIHRVERPNSAAPGLTAVYTGHLRSGRFEGTFTAKWPGHFPNMKPRDVISGSWFATAPSTTCAPDPGIQDAKEAGALAARFEHLPQALQCFRKAAEKGDGPAKAVVGLMYRDGIGTIPNTAEALKWLQSAATQEEYNAQVALAQMYAVGIDGSPPDRAKADAWRDRALHNPAYVAREEAAKRQERAQQMMFMGLAAVVEAMAAPTVYVRSAW